MIEIEGIATTSPSAREDHDRGKGYMTLFFTLSPWRQVGGEWMRPPVRIEIATDLDFADAWMQAIDAGHTLRVECTALVPGGDDHPAVAQGTENIRFPVILA